VSKKELRVKNIDRKSNHENLKAYFDQFGVTTKVKFMARDIAFIEYEKPEEAAAA